MYLEALKTETQEMFRDSNTSSIGVRPTTTTTTTILLAFLRANSRKVFTVAVRTPWQRVMTLKGWVFPEAVGRILCTDPGGENTQAESRPKN